MVIDRFLNHRWRVTMDFEQSKIFARGRRLLVGGFLLGVFWAISTPTGIQVASAQDAAAADKVEEPVEAGGLGSVGITKTRVVFEGRKRSDSVVLINRGTRKTTYRIFFQNLRMSVDGQYTEIKEPAAGENFAQGLVSFSPRQVTLEPSATQTIRLTVRTPEGTVPGEYRSHLYFQALPSDDVGTNIESVGGKEDRLQVQMVPIYGLSIPIIVRVGELQATASLKNVSVVTSPEGGQAIKFDALREGSKSVYGDVTALYTPVGGSDPE
jgi:hypothetical protein